MPAVWGGIEAFAMDALVSRGFRFAVVRRARLPLAVFTLKEPPIAGGISLLSWTIFFFFGTDFIVDGLLRLSFIGRLASAFSRLFDSRSNLETSLYETFCFPLDRDHNCRVCGCADCRN
jgi:hypothetical protein